MFPRFGRVAFLFRPGQEVREARHRAQRGPHVVYQRVGHMMKLPNHLPQLCGAPLDQYFQLLRVRPQFCLSFP